MKFVYSPEEEDCIPIWLDYKNNANQEIWKKYVEKYLKKCKHVIKLNF